MNTKELRKPNLNRLNDARDTTDFLNNERSVVSRKRPTNYSLLKTESQSTTPPVPAARRWIILAIVLGWITLNFDRYAKGFLNMINNPDPSGRIISMFWILATALLILGRVRRLFPALQVSEERKSLEKGALTLIILVFAIGSIVTLFIMQSEQSAVYVPAALKSSGKYPTIIGLTSDHAVRRDIDVLHDACDQNNTIAIGIRIDPKDPNWKSKFKQDIKTLEQHNPIDEHAIYLSTFDNTVEPGFSLLASDPNFAKGLIATNGHMSCFNRRVEPTPFKLPRGEKVMMFTNKHWAPMMKEDKDSLEKYFGWKSKMMPSEHDGFAEKKDVSDAVHWLLN